MGRIGMREGCVFALIAALVIATAPAEDADIGADPAPGLLAEEQLWDLYYQYLAILKPEGVPIERKEHEKALRPRVMLRDHEDVWTYTEHLFVLGRNNGVRLGLDGATGELRSYWHDALMEAHPDLKAGSRPARVAPTMREAQVRQLAERYLVLNTRIEMDDYHIKVWYEQTYWLIRIERRLNGIPFRIDAVSMSYSEKHGLFRYENELFSNECAIEPRLPKEEILEAGKGHLETIMRERGAGFEMEEPKVSGPEILNPGTLKQGRRPPLAELRKTRLGWTLFYGEKKPAVVAPEQMPRCIAIYVDALTGDLLGHKRF